MSGKHYIPRAQYTFQQWSACFNNYMTANAVRFNLSQERVDDYNQKHTAMVVAMTTAQNPGTRGPSVTRAKNDAIDAAKSAARNLAQWIIRQPDTTNHDLVSMQLPLRRPGSGGGSVPRPTERPAVFVQARDASQLELRLRNPNSRRRGKPAGAILGRVFMHLGDTPPRSTAECGWCESVSRATCIVRTPPNARPGDSLWVIACWMNAKGEEGPLSTPVQVIVPVGLNMRVA